MGADLQKRRRRLPLRSRRDRRTRRCLLVCGALLRLWNSTLRTRNEACPPKGMIGTSPRRLCRVRSLGGSRLLTCDLIWRGATLACSTRRCSPLPPVRGVGAAASVRAVSRKTAGSAPSAWTRSVTAGPASSTGRVNDGTARRPCRRHLCQITVSKEKHPLFRSQRSEEENQRPKHYGCSSKAGAETIPRKRCPTEQAWKRG